MSLASWILDQFIVRRRKGNRAQLAERREESISLYLRRLEDRRVLSITAVEDAYFVDGFQTSFFTPPQLGVLSNDSNTGNGTLAAFPGTFSTAQGGTVNLFSDGSFDYFTPFSPGSIYVDQFQYTATNGMEFSAPITVTLYGGEISVRFDQTTPLPIFGVETETPGDFVQVMLSSSQGGSLFLSDTTGIAFESGFNGASSFHISGMADDVNRALDTFDYTSPIGYSGFDDLYFEYYAGIEVPPPGGDFSQFVPLFVDPPEGGFSQGPGSGTIVTVDDEYYVNPAGQGMFFVGPQAGVLSNDFSTEGGSLFIFSETITTDLGGTVDLFTDGGFLYHPPSSAFGESFVDSFVYFATDEVNFSPGFVTLFVGEVAVPEDINVLLPLFTVESELPGDLATVQLSSSQGSSLLLFNTAGISFLSGFNGGSSFTITGQVHDLNLALDTLDYLPPLDFSGDDFLTFQYEIIGQRFSNPVTQIVPINVLPIADPPVLSITPQPVGYLPGVFTPVNIDVTLVDVDGSEIPGLVILDFVPAGVIPSVGQQSPINPQTYFILPGELENLSFFIDFAAPEFFTIDVIATSIETTNQPGVFGGPGGPLLPDHPFEPRFALSGQFLDFFRLPPPDVPPPPVTPPPPPGLAPPVVFLLGPLSGPTPPPRLHGGPHHAPPADAPKIIAAVISSHESSTGNNTTTTLLVTSNNSVSVARDVVTVENQNNEQGRRSHESSGIYVSKLGGDGPGQTARLPEELSEDYPRFMEFLKTLPNGDYVVYFKRSGQSHEQASLRQAVLRVRVVNHRLNPDPGEFKPAGEVAEPPQNPGVPATTEMPAPNERADVSPSETWVAPVQPAAAAATHTTNEWTPITAGAWMAAVASWKLRRKHDTRSSEVDDLMERYAKKPARCLLRRVMKSHS